MRDGAEGELEAGMEPFGGRRLWVSSWSENNLVVTEGFMLQRELTEVSVVWCSACGKEVRFTGQCDDGCDRLT